MGFKELLAAAKKALADGDLVKAEELTKKAKAMKSLEELEEKSGSGEGELDALKSEVKSLRQLIAEAPSVSNTGVQVVEDEADKEKKLRPWKSLGEQLIAIKNAYQFPHNMDNRLKAEGQKAVLGAAEGQGSDGGFLVQTDFSSEIVKRAYELAVFAARARKIPIGANANGLKMNAIDETSRANGSRFGGIRGYWLAEAGTLTGSQPKLRQMEWSLKKLGLLMYATDELLQDSTALGAIMQEGASEEVAFLVDESIYNGSGAGKPQGIMSSAAKVAVSAESGQASTEILVENVFKMWSRMWSKSRMNAAWFVNQDIEPALFGMTFPVGTGGQPVYMPPGGINNSPYATLMGRPIIPTEFNETLGTEGDILFADLSQYLIVDKGGIQQASSIHVQFLTDQTAFRWIYRVDGQSLWSAPLTPFKGSNTLSPFVTLATR
jgi:HK97 family phage major capsid protein